MKATAKHWVNYNGAWHRTGETFDVRPEDAEQVKRFADIGKEPVQETAPETVEEPVRRTRKRKADA